MTQDVALRLGELARDRSDGRLTLADYRRLRAPLLDRLVSHDADPVDESSRITRPRAVVRAPKLDAVVVSARRPRFAPWMLWALVVGSLTVVAGMRAWAPSTRESDTPIEPVQVTVTAAVVTAPTASAPAAERRPSVKTAKSVAKSGACQFKGASAPPAPCEDRLTAHDLGPRLYVVPAPEGTGGFALSAQAISQLQFRTYCERTGRPFPNQPWVEDNDPVVNVTWDEARSYARWLSNETGQSYRLPTEDEWVQAAHVLGGRDGFSAGKVREWMEDAWTGEPDQRVVRGASYADDSTTVLSARRNRIATIRDALTGFRTVRDIR